jgi:hypothetical protein
MQADGLIVRTISKPLPISDQQLRIEAPSNNRSGDDIVITIRVCSLRNIEKLSASARVSNSGRS